MKHQAENIRSGLRLLGWSPMLTSKLITAAFHQICVLRIAPPLTLLCIHLLHLLMNLSPFVRYGTVPKCFYWECPMYRWERYDHVFDFSPRWGLNAVYTLPFQDFDEKRQEWRKQKKSVLSAISLMRSRTLRFEDSERRTIALSALDFYTVGGASWMFGCIRYMLYGRSTETAAKNVTSILYS